MSAIPKFIPLRDLQDGHHADCMCKPCLEADAGAHPDPISDDLDNEHPEDCRCSECLYAYEEEARSDA